jgi:hypothetical protein
MLGFQGGVSIPLVKGGVKAHLHQANACKTLQSLIRVSEGHPFDVHCAHHLPLKGPPYEDETRDETLCQESQRATRHGVCSRALRSPGASKRLYPTIQQHIDGQRCR